MLSHRSTPHPPAEVHVLTGLQCRSWIGDQRYGTLGLTTGRGWRSTVVTFAATDAEVVFRLPDYNPISQYAYGRWLSLQVSSTDPDRTRTEVVVTGTGYLPDDPDALARTVDLSEDWPLWVATRIVCLDLAGVRGSVRHLAHAGH